MRSKLVPSARGKINDILFVRCLRAYKIHLFLEIPGTHCEYVPSKFCRFKSFLETMTLLQECHQPIQNVTLKSYHIASDTRPIALDMNPICAMFSYDLRSEWVGCTPHCCRKKYSRGSLPIPEFLVHVTVSRIPLFGCQYFTT